MRYLLFETYLGKYILRMSGSLLIFLIVAWLGQTIGFSENYAYWFAGATFVEIGHLMK